VGGPQSTSECYTEEKNTRILLILEVEPRFLPHPTHSDVLTRIGISFAQRLTDLQRLCAPQTSNPDCIPHMKPFEVLSCLASVTCVCVCVWSTQTHSLCDYRYKRFNLLNRPSLFELKKPCFINPISCKKYSFRLFLFPRVSLIGFLHISHSYLDGCFLTICQNTTHIFMSMITASKLVTSNSRSVKDQAIGMFRLLGLKVRSLAVITS
jgi:hypothetical protein